MLSQHSRPSTHQTSDCSDQRPTKRLKAAAVGQHVGGRAKAERWFNDTNNNASGTKDVPYLDNDPPFYLNGKTYSGGASACAVHSDGSSFNLSKVGQPTAPTRSLLAQMEANESNSEDFRSVIDDLTIQNKRLRKKLKQYQRLHCSHLQDEKLFEVRIHGLAAHRKRELEEILRSFASSNGEWPETTLCNSDNFRVSAPVLSNHKPPSSSTSYSKGSKPIDSTYASMSGHTGVSQKQSQDHKQKDKQAQSDSRLQNVQSYLHDISETLVPKHSLAMSERAKSRLVVRRLEQIFTGRRAAGRHTQSHQQQEVSQSAARADRIQLEACGRKFQPIPRGVREARILPSDAELKVDSLSEANLAAQQSEQTAESRGRVPLKEGMREARILFSCAESQIDSSSETNLTGQQSRQSTDRDDSRSRDPRAARRVTPDQRPTHPLDLDIHRAQVPSDNVEYIRHLGLASPTATSNINTDPDDGWVFLNLLTSMAQLHTLNVTPEFIRHAVADLSSKFELSTDGTKVRWQGGTDGTKMSSDSDESEDTGNQKSADIRLSVGKRGSLADMPSTAGAVDLQEPKIALPVPTIGFLANSEFGAKRRPVHLGQPNELDKIQYKPLFFHGPISEDDDDSAHATDSVTSFDPMENATGLNSGSHGIRESELKLRKQSRENGPIIFYNKARFCTDLSGDSSGTMHDEDAYCRYTQEPIGGLQHVVDEKFDESKSDYGLNVDCATESMDLDQGGPSTRCCALDLEDLKSSISDLSITSPIPMEVSGVGQILPEDNFMVKVQVRHGERTGRVQSSLYNPRSQVRRLLHGKSQGYTDSCHEAKDIPRSQPNRGPISNEIISIVKTDMPPSSLPSPVYIRSTSESEDGDDEDEDEDEDLSVNYYSEKPRASPKPSVEDVVDPRLVNFFFGSTPDESKKSSYASTSSGSDDDSSIDFLANARVLEPDTIAAQEREFEFNHVQPLVRAGSVAEAAQEPTYLGSGLPRSDKTESDVDSMSVDGDAEDN